jgi:hypothetical protein
MPIITPVYPQQNSTFNVSDATRDRILEEMTRAYEICLRIDRGQLPWTALWEKRNFFIEYRRFIQITAHANDAVIPLCFFHPKFLFLFLKQTETNRRKWLRLLAWSSRRFASLPSVLRRAWL